MSLAKRTLDFASLSAGINWRLKLPGEAGDAQVTLHQFSSTQIVNSLIKLNHDATAGSDQVGKANNVVQKAAVALGAGGSVTIDLADASDWFGLSAPTLTRIKGLIVVNKGALVTDPRIRILPAASNGFSDWITGTAPKIIVPPGGAFYIGCDLDPYLASATAKNLTIENVSGSVATTFDLCCIGVE